MGNASTASIPDIVVSALLFIRTPCCASSVVVALPPCIRLRAEASFSEHVPEHLPSEVGEVMDEESRDHSRKTRHRRRTAHVLLLLHLIRGADDFHVTFDSRWECVFVDSVGDGSSWNGINGSGLPVDGDVDTHSKELVKDQMPSAVDAAGKSILEVVLGLDPSEVTHDKSSHSRCTPPA